MPWAQPIRDTEIKVLKAALTNDVDNRETIYERHRPQLLHEGYTTFKTEEL